MRVDQETVVLDKNGEKIRHPDRQSADADFSVGGPPAGIEARQPGDPYEGFAGVEDADLFGEVSDGGRGSCST